MHFNYSFKMIYPAGQTGSVEQIRRVFEDNSGIILPRRGDSNEHPQHMFLWRTDENFPSIFLKYPPYLFPLLQML